MDEPSSLFSPFPLQTAESSLHTRLLLLLLAPSFPLLLLLRRVWLLLLFAAVVVDVSSSCEVSSIIIIIIIIIMDFENCPSIAPFFGYLGVACSCVLASKFGWLKCHV